MEMFDEIVSTKIEHGKVTGEERERIEDTLQAEAMQEACRVFLTAERKFRKISEHPDVVTDPKVNGEWWDALELVYRSERTVWRLFVGPQPDMRSNRLYARFRGLLLKGKNLTADA
ncbi:MAG TPA: hypothetical protein VFN26_17600 [Candidatus Acidoferrum sp.]|nr:hypothetical protein [Candidatus Acidoferrum sp.]